MWILGVLFLLALGVTRGIGAVVLLLVAILGIHLLPQAVPSIFELNETDLWCILVLCGSYVVYSVFETTWIHVLTIIVGIVCAIALAVEVYAKDEGWIKGILLWFLEVFVIPTVILRVFIMIFH